MVAALHAFAASRTATILLAVLVALAGWIAAPELLGAEQFNGIPAAQEEPDAPSASETAAPAEPVDVEISLSEALATLPVETYQVFLSRDPFQPVVVAPLAVDGDGNPIPGGDGDGTTGTPGDPSCEAGSNTATCENLTVTLLDVTSDANGTRIIVQVNDTLYEVTVGSIFAGSFQVLAISAPCADLLFGDDSFTLCQGDRVLK
ncbi:MAG: hypothetical protein ACI867_000379 [Glaciecola sp.]|jgi:hypothetical protein